MADEVSNVIKWTTNPFGFASEIANAMGRNQDALRALLPKEAGWIGTSSALAKIAAMPSSFSFTPPIASGVFAPIASGAFGQITAQMERHTEAAKVWGVFSRKIGMELNITQSQLGKAFETSHRFKELFGTIPQQNFVSSFNAVAASAVMKGFDRPELGHLFDQVFDAVDKIVPAEPTDENFEGIGSRFEKIFTLLIDMWGEVNTPAGRFYIMFTIALLSLAYTTYRAQTNEVPANIDKLLTQVNQIAYNSELNDSGELIVNAVRQETRIARIATKIYSKPLRNSGVVHHVSEDQEMIITFRFKKYLFVAFSDCHSGKLFTGFILKKHLVK